MKLPAPLAIFALLLGTGAALSGQTGMRLASFHSSGVRCGGVEQVPVRAPRPLPVATMLGDPGSPIRFTFRIDGEGRPLGIKGVGAAAPALDSNDLAPALAAWRFEAGQPQSGCEIAFNVRLDTVDNADDALLYRYAALGRLQTPGGVGGALVGAAFARLRPPGSTCATDPVPSEPISLPYQAIPEPIGEISYSFFSYDVDEAGQPVHIRLLNSSGNRQLDAAGDIAIGRARFAPRPLTGCLQYFYRFSTIAAPAPSLPAADLHPRGAACAPEIGGRLAAQLSISYPAGFERRPTDGWVAFRFDVAPSGELHDIVILASEPADRFGEEVARAAASANLGAMPRAQLGCVQRVRFRMAPR